MKKLVIILAALLILMSAFFSQHKFKSGIQGAIEPAEGAKKIWAISGADSVSAVPLMGKFLLDLKAGNWKLYIEAIQPYRNTTVESVLVVDGEYTDAGVIKLPS
ncbi:MAG TPA: hypothetical protein VGO21_03525 [Candidatus Paceibacterota bacterium]|nr:hypothetical protein [Candidatus Paceibacterota bacterium]